MARAQRMVTDGAEIEGLVTLHVVVPARIDLKRVPNVLGARDLPWLGERVTDAGGSPHPYWSDLEFHLRGMSPVVPLVSSR